MTVIVGAPSSRSNSRTKAPGRMSLSKLRHGSSGGQGPSSSVGGQPLAGAAAEPKGPRDIKHRFEITRKLGSGTYGKVSLAYDHKTEREVAVKLIKKSAIENKQDLIRIRREIRIMSMLKHPNIIQIYEVFENKDKIILVMEYASGGELYDYVSKFGCLPESEARRIFRQITSAVLYCHKHKVCHRDLKLENILLDLDNNAKIADFGLSNYFDGKMLLRTFCGSPLYASPEIINGTPYIGPEVDCWSLGILLYTLVYGSMPFDGHDFNRMVRQIKRGAYYEPDTPSTASMLIRNMLRVNPERRADIDDIASHWWLNLEENMPVIQELPENQILDHTPLTERAETMVVQDLADETDVFMEFGHLSADTRRKIEEFRRRRQHAEEYNENSPIKPPKTRKTDGKELTTNEKSLRQQQEGSKDQAAKTSTPPAAEKSAFHDPLERLRQLESRLQGGGRQSPDQQQPGTSKERRNSKPTTPTLQKAPNLSPTKKEATDAPAELEPDEDKKPHFVSPTEATEGRKSQSKKSLDNGAAAWKMETDSLNVLMNQVLEQMDKGPVSINLVARVKAHPMYEQRPMVKELLESIIAAQPAAVRKETSKVIEQTQGLARKQGSSHGVEKSAVASPIAKVQPPAIPEEKALPPKSAPAKKDRYQVAELPTKIDVKAAVAQKRAALLEERKWHSVEVGFETDEESSSNGSGKASKAMLAPTAKPTALTGRARSAGHEESEELVDEEAAEAEEEEEYESEIDELADVVEQVAQSSSQLVPKPPKIVESLAENEKAPPKQPEISADHLSTLERGLAKRQSKGKYQHTHVEMYGRGVSTETTSPPPEKPKIGGPQPTIEQLPVLFDKAKKFLMKFPEKPEDSDDEAAQKKKAKPPASWKKSQDPDITDKSATATPTPIRRASDATGGDANPATLAEAKEKPEKAKKEKLAPKASQEPNDDDDEEESEEESEDEGEPIRRPRTSAIIGFRTIQTTDGSRREAPIVEIKPQTKPYAGINAVSTTPPKTDEKTIGGNRTTAADPAADKVRSSVDREAASKTPSSIESRRSSKASTIAAKVERRHSQLERRNSRTGTTADTTNASSALERRNSRSGVDTSASALERRNSRSGADPSASALERRNSRSGIDSSKDNNSSNVYRAERRQSRDFGGGGSYGRQAAYADRRKSLHEYSPIEQHDDFATVYGGAPMGLGGTSRGAPPPPNASSYAYGGGSQRYTTSGQGPPTSRFGPQSSMDEEVAYLSGGFVPDSPGFAAALGATGAHFFGGGPLTHHPANATMNAQQAPPQSPLTTNTSSSTTNFYYTPAVAAFMAMQGVERPASAYEPSSRNRFEVYQTRAERAAHEHANAALGYRPTSQYYPERPASSYIGGGGAGGPGSGGAPSSGGYRSRYEDYSSAGGYRRPYDDRPLDFDPFMIGPPPDYMPGPSTFAPPPEPTFSAMNAGNNRFRPVSRRLGSALRDVDGRRARARSHSSDQKQYSGTAIDVEAAAALANRMMTPETGPADYGYISYHDSANSRVSQPREPDITMTPTRGILKNKQAYEIEPRGDPIGYGLRRHMSAEKDLYSVGLAPQPMPGFRFGSIGPTGAPTMAGSHHHHYPMAQPPPHYHAPIHSVYAPQNFGIGGGGEGSKNASRVLVTKQRAFASECCPRCAVLVVADTKNKPNKRRVSIAERFWSARVAPVKRARVRLLFPKASDFYEPTGGSSSKKRSTAAGGGGSNFLSSARRRTAEIRLGNDGKLTTTANGYLLDDVDYKRPRSPIDRIKSLFGGGGGIGSSSAAKKTAGAGGGYTSGANGVSSRYTSATSGGSAGGASSGAGASSQFKRYTGGTTNTRYGGGRW